MTDPVPQPPTTAARAVRLPESLHWAAARRLVSQHLPDRNAAATRLVTGAAAHGIDFSLTWGTTHTSAGPEPVRQVCLAVLGSGRTAMCFVSEPAPGGDPGGPEIGVAERAASIRAACAELPKLKPGAARIAQALPEPGDHWAIDAFREAGFTHVGDLSYMRRVGPLPADPQPVVWPEGVRVVRVDELGDRAAQDATLIAALDRTYIDTLDCPELCGLRETSDILHSHRATGRWDPSLWWVVMTDGAPEGCLLLNRMQDRGGAELVYLGLSPALRGRRLGAALLKFGLARLGRASEVNCAVDERNEPAIRLYRRLGFASFARRVALVRSLVVP